MKSILILLVVAFSFAFSAENLVSTNAGSLNVLVSKAKENVSAATAIYSAAFSGSQINGQKILVGCSVTDSSAAAGFQGKTYDIDLEGSFDGTNFVTISAAAINDKVLSVAGAANLAVGVGTVDLSSYVLPYYRLKFTPSATVGTGGKFKFYVSGLK